VARNRWGETGEGEGGGVEEEDEAVHAKDVVESISGERDRGSSEEGKSRAGGARRGSYCRGGSTITAE